jgi:hypothetical protein
VTAPPENPVDEQPIVGPGSSRVASLARQKLVNPTPLRLRKFVSLRHAPRPESLDPERNESALARPENPECRLDLGHTIKAVELVSAGSAPLGMAVSDWRRPAVCSTNALSLSCAPNFGLY